MKTASFVLREEHIEWLKQKAEEAGHSPSSAVLRRILTEAMDRELQAVSTETVEPTQQN